MLLILLQNISHLDTGVALALDVEVRLGEPHEDLHDVAHCAAVT